MNAVFCEKVTFFKDPFFLDLVVSLNCSTVTGGRAQK